MIPTHLLSREHGKRDLTNLVITDDKHERKKVMFMNSDAILVMPGGTGSLDEFFEVLTWAEIGLHGKPIFLLNTAGYGQPLLTLIDHIITPSFADLTLRDWITVLDDAPALQAALSTF